MFDQLDKAIKKPSVIRTGQVNVSRYPAADEKVAEDGMQFFSRHRGFCHI